MNTPGQANQSAEETLGNGANEDDPSMEEILSSIRRIISDDDEEGAEADGSAASEAAMPAPEPEPEKKDEVLELTDIFNDDKPEEPTSEEVPEPEPQAAPADEVNTALADPMDISEDEIDFDMSEPEPEPEPVEQEQPAPEAPSGESEILSADAELASSASFNKLAETILSHSRQTRTVEELIQEMLKPMLKTWLDENLPDTVERLVREEIERVARRR